MDELTNSLRSVKYLAIDRGGVLFTNDEWHAFVVNGVSIKPKQRSHSDGQGITFLRALGIQICVFTTGVGESALAAKELVDRWNKLHTGAVPGQDVWPAVTLIENVEGQEKKDAVEKWLTGLGGTWKECAVMGNDFGDAQILKAAGVPTAPSDADESIQSLCSFVSKYPGGQGAIRELANTIIKVRGIDPFTLPVR